MDVDKKNTVIISVPHTGTRFVRKHFGEPQYYHSWLRWEDVMRRADYADKIFIPLRHPQDVYYSWQKRERFYDHTGAFRWYTAWQQLQMVYHMYDCDVICVDKKEDKRIKDWTVVGSDGKEPQKPNFDVRWDVLFQLPVVKDHYEL